MAETTSYWHRLRKRIHLLCFAIFLALPFLDIMRFDIPRQRFYFVGRELWINELGIIFLTLMFLMFLVVACSVFYGRVYCSYACPQMIFSEASVWVETRIQRFTVKHFIQWPPKQRQRAARAAFYAVVALASVFLAFVFIAYFVEPRELLRRLATLDVHTAAGGSGAAVTLLTFLDFSLVRQRFCTTACPYGYLQGVLGDGNTLLVHYRDERYDCIECKKCVRVCPMGIDIRTSPFQIECIHCGECIDACREVLARLNKRTLIHYTWGEKGELAEAGAGAPWYRRIGLRDAKRVVVLLVLTCYAASLVAALSMRHAVLVRIAPERATLYRLGPDGRVYNRFRYELANRSRARASVVFSIRQFPAGTLAIPSNPVTVAAGAVARGEFEISAPARSSRDLVTHFTIVTATVPGQESDTFPMTFLAPGERPNL